MNINICIIHGTSRPENKSLSAAQYVKSILNSKFPQIESILVSPSDFNLPFDGQEPGNKDNKYTEVTAKADGFIIVTPEYNHSIPGSLKRLLDSEYSNYNRKSVAIAGVSDGAWGGVRAIEALIHVTKALGLLSIKIDMQFPRIIDLFDNSGKPKDNSIDRRTVKWLEEMVWLTIALKKAREQG
jgi:NAD(P)H-dependent FMN reductase